MTDTAVDVVGRVSDQYVFFSPRKGEIQLLDINTLEAVQPAKQVEVMKTSLRCYVENKFGVVLGFSDMLVSFDTQRNFSIKNKVARQSAQYMLNKFNNDYIMSSTISGEIQIFAAQTLKTLCT